MSAPHPSRRAVYSVAKSVTLAAGATALPDVDQNNNTYVITGDAGANTVSTMAGGAAGLVVHLLFVDALVTVTDTGADTADTINLNAAFTSAAGAVLTLIHNGTKWFEVSRSNLTSYTGGSIATPLIAPAGTVGAPGIALSDADDGFYESADGTIAVAIAGAANGVAFDSNGAVLTSSGFQIRSVDVAITSAQITGTGAEQLNHANGITAVAAPGSNKMIRVLAVEGSYLHATAAYTGGSAWGLYWDSININALANTFGTAYLTTAQSTQFFQNGAASQTSGSSAVNRALKVWASGAAFTQPGTAAGTIRLRIYYYVENWTAFPY